MKYKPIYFHTPFLTPISTEKNTRYAILEVVDIYI